MNRNAMPLVIAGILLFGDARAADAKKPAIATRDLPNGLHALCIRFPGSTNVSIFTFAPLSLATDAAHQAQWSHLVEHLVIRSTIPNELREANAETLPDNMRLDFYGNANNWLDGLSHHRRWLEGVPFTQNNLDNEKPKVNQECDYTARNFATHKFAIAAWNQGFRHHLNSVKLKGDVLRATLPEIQRLRDERLVISNQVSICVIGGLEPSQVLSEIERQFSKIKLRPPPDLRTKPKNGNLDLTWDLEARHLLLTWPIPAVQDADYPTLLILSQLLNQALATDAQLTKGVGMLFAGADLTVPEGNFFYISASLRPESNFDSLRNSILERVAKVTTDALPMVQIPFVAKYLSQQMVELPSLEEIKAQVPPNTDMARMEGNLGLMFGMNFYRYGVYRTTLSRRIASVTAADVQRVLKKYLASGKAATYTIKPE